MDQQHSSVRRGFEFWSSFLADHLESSCFHADAKSSTAGRFAVVDLGLQNGRRSQRGIRLLLRLGTVEPTRGSSGLEGLGAASVDMKSLHECSMGCGMAYGKCGMMYGMVWLVEYGTAIHCRRLWLAACMHLTQRADGVQM